MKRKSVIIPMNMNDDLFYALKEAAEEATERRGYEVTVPQLVKEAALSGHTRSRLKRQSFIKRWWGRLTKRHKRVILKESVRLLDAELKKGVVGKVQNVCKDGRAYEVAFPWRDGDTILITLSAEQVQPA